MVLMASSIRQLLASAQAAEISGDFGKAVEFLRSAEAFYLERSQTSRAQQMVRQIMRLESRQGQTPTLGFGDELIDGVPPQVDESENDGPASSANAIDAEALEFERVMSLTEPTADAWCSFCCRPQSLVGRLAAGPAGAYTCASCATTAVELIGGGPVSRSEAPPAPQVREPIAAVTSELRTQREARGRLQRPHRLALVIGPEGTGKSHLLQHLGDAVSAFNPAHRGSVQALDLQQRLSEADEAALLRWLEAHAGRRVVLAARAVAPEPALVLSSAQGEERIYDSGALAQSVAHLVSPALAGRVDLVIALERPDAEALKTLALHWLEARGATLPEAAVDQLVAVSLKSGRALHELKALVQRVPAGQWS